MHLTALARVVVSWWFGRLLDFTMHLTGCIREVDSRSFGRLLDFTMHLLVGQCTDVNSTVESAGTKSGAAPRSIPILHYQDPHSGRYLRPKANREKCRVPYPILAVIHSVLVYLEVLEAQHRVAQAHQCYGSVYLPGLERTLLLGSSLGRKQRQSAFVSPPTIF